MKKIAVLMLFLLFVFAEHSNAKTIIVGSHGGPEVLEDPVSNLSNSQEIYYPMSLHWNRDSDPKALRSADSVANGYELNDGRKWRGHGIDASMIYYQHQRPDEEVFALISVKTSNPLAAAYYVHHLYENGDKVFLIGYSSGADFVINVADILDYNGYTVHLLGLIDAFTIKSVPSNVEKVALYYQTQEDLKGRNSIGFDDDSVTSYFSGHPLLIANVNHEGIDNEDDVWEDLGEKMDNEAATYVPDPPSVEPRLPEDDDIFYDEEGVGIIFSINGSLNTSSDPGGGTSNPYIQSTDIHITHCEIRPYKEGSWHHEVDVDMAPGQTFLFELEGRVRNKSNYDLEDVDIDYCFVKDVKDFDVQTKRRIDDDQVDIKEGEKESKHSRRSRVVIASDLSSVSVSTDGGSSFSLPITQENLTSEEITLYFYLDVETENSQDRDVSDEAKADEYAKLEIHLNLPQPPPPDLNLSVPYDQEYIKDKTKIVLTGQAIEIPIVVQKSGDDTLTSHPGISLVLSGPEFESPQTLTPLSANYSDLNSEGADTLNVQISSINTPGDYYLKVCIDPQNYISETNEYDNCNYVHFVVKKRKNQSPINYLLLQPN